MEENLKNPTFVAFPVKDLRRENYEAEKWGAKWGRDFMTTNGDSVQPMLLGIVVRCQNQKMNAKSVSV